MTLGTIRHISRYPVKSMQGESLESVDIDFVGLPFDRAFAFVKDGVYTPFPWFTARDCPELLQCRPILGEGRWPTVRVDTPGGEFELASPEFKTRLLEWSGLSASLRTDYRGCQDVAYVSIISTATIRALSEAGGVPTDYRRFRMNFVVDVGDEPFTENAWAGKALSLGGASIAIHQPDRRCNMITLHPETGESTPAVLKQAGELNSACAGMYGSVLVEGRVTVGDTLAFA
ncbi:MAG: MOSC domain-containing protein [Dehalococcoidia bacterium]|nr:MOSC domain-containing protein [Dehalococcoidia bacterium]